MQHGQQKLADNPKEHDPKRLPAGMEPLDPLKKALSSCAGCWLTVRQPSRMQALIAIRDIQPGGLSSHKFVRAALFKKTCSRGSDTAKMTNHCEERSSP